MQKRRRILTKDHKSPLFITIPHRAQHIQKNHEWIRIKEQHMVGVELFTANWCLCTRWIECNVHLSTNAYILIIKRGLSLIHLSLIVVIEWRAHWKKIDTSMSTLSLYYSLFIRRTFADFYFDHSRALASSHVLDL